MRFRVRRQPSIEVVSRPSAALKQRILVREYPCGRVREILDKDESSKFARALMAGIGALSGMGAVYFCASTAKKD